jgi:phage major head subunit gpT-like protein
MPALTPSFLMDLETRMSHETESEYNRLADARNLWWQLITRTRTTEARRDIVTWLLSTAQIKDQGQGGNTRFDDLVSAYTEIEHGFSGASLKLTRSELTDIDGGGIDLAAQWSSDIGAYMGYWPQEQASIFLKNAHTASFTTYDKKPFFAVDHPVNPYRDQVTFANLFTGGAAGNYPGALPIDTPDLEEAFKNLQKLYAYIASIKMPNGSTPRFLRPKGLLVPPQLMLRATQITGAKFIAMAAGGGAAAPTDVEGLITSMGYAPPVQADELADFEGGRTYFVVCEQLSQSRIGALIYTIRDPFRIDYYGEQSEAELKRRNEFEWHCQGRNGISAGHPYLLFKVKAA